MKCTRFVCLALALLTACSVQAATMVAINFGSTRGSTDVDDTGSGGYFWTVDGFQSNGDTVTVTPLKSITGAATDFEIQMSDTIRLDSGIVGGIPTFELDGVRLPGGVTVHGYGGIDGSYGNALWAVDIRVPVASGLDGWSLQLFAGEKRNGGLSPMAANVGGTFVWDIVSGTGAFTGGFTTTFDGPATDPDGLGVDWFRSGRLDNLLPVVQNIGGIDYYVATLQFADTGRLVAGTVDYTTLRGLVLTAVHIPEPTSIALLGLAALVALRRPRLGAATS